MFTLIFFFIFMWILEKVLEVTGKILWWGFELAAKFCLGFAILAVIISVL